MLLKLFLSQRSDELSDLFVAGAMLVWLGEPSAIWKVRESFGRFVSMRANASIPALWQLRSDY